MGKSSLFADKDQAWAEVEIFAELDGVRERSRMERSAVPSRHQVEQRARTRRTDCGLRLNAKTRLFERRMNSSNCWRIFAQSSRRTPSFARVSNETKLPKISSLKSSGRKLNVCVRSRIRQSRTPRTL